MSRADVLLRWYEGKTTQRFGGGTTTYTFDTLLHRLNRDDDFCERTHDFIQWIFPTDRRSRACPTAPFLKRADFARLSKDRVRRAFHTFLRFLMRTDKWKRPNDHNQLRITRVLVCLRRTDLYFEESTLRTFLERENVRNRHWTF